MVTEEAIQHLKNSITVTYDEVENLFTATSSFMPTVVSKSRDEGDAVNIVLVYLEFFL